MVAAEWYETPEAGFESADRKAGERSKELALRAPPLSFMSSLEPQNRDNFLDSVGIFLG